MSFLKSKKTNRKLENKQVSTREEILSWIVVISVAFLLAMVFKTFLYENFKIPSGSMNPTLLAGDRVLVNKFHYGYSSVSFPLEILPIKGRFFDKNQPKRGDIIVFKTADLKNKNFYIKRVVGIPGDKIKIKKGEVIINGKKLKYELKGEVPAFSTYNHNAFEVRLLVEDLNGVKHNIFLGGKDWPQENTGEYVVPDGYYFCMGDNRDNSHDCRFEDFGMVPYERISGRADRIFFSTANNKLNFGRILANLKN